MLRKVTSISSAKMAKELSISVRALSTLEKQEDILVETANRYVEALGGKLDVNAAFPSESLAALAISQAFDYEIEDDAQLLLPIFGSEDVRPKRDVVLSIKPEYSSQILIGRKTVELRRRFPVDVPTGTMVYIYSTTPEKALVGFAEIDSVVKKSISSIWRSYKAEACIAKSDFDSYFSGLEYGFALRFKRAGAFKQSITLADLRERFNFEPPQSFFYAKPHLREALKYEFAELPS